MHVISLMVSKICCSSIKAGHPEETTQLLNNVAFQYPGFLELDDLNDRMLTYSAQDKCAFHQLRLPCVLPKHVPGLASGSL